MLKHRRSVAPRPRRTSLATDDPEELEGRGFLDGIAEERSGAFNVDLSFCADSFLRNAFVTHASQDAFGIGSR